MQPNELLRHILDLPSASQPSKMNKNGTNPNSSDEEGPVYLTPLDVAEAEGNGYAMGYRDGLKEGVDIGRSLGYDEVAHRMRVLLENNHDHELIEAFERLIG